MPTSLSVSSPPPHPSLSKPKRQQIRGKLKAALDAIVWKGEAWNEAALNVNFAVHSMRAALARPHVRQYLSEQKQVFRESISAQNIVRAAQIRDQDENRTAAVQAMKYLDTAPDTPGNASAARTPGVVIVIGNSRVDASITPNDAKPLIDQRAVTAIDVSVTPERVDYANGEADDD